MSAAHRWWSGTHSVRTRILAIALIPSLLLAVAAAGVVTNLVVRSMKDRDWADENLRTATPAAEFMEALLSERRVTLLRIVGRSLDGADLPSLRRRVDDSALSLAQQAKVVSAVVPGSFEAELADFTQKLTQLPGLRAQVDAGGVSVQDAYRFYGDLFDNGTLASDIVVGRAPNVSSALGAATTRALFGVVDAMSRAHTLAIAVATEDGIPGEFMREFVSQLAVYHRELSELTRGSEARVTVSLTTLIASPAWRELIAIENAVIQQGVKQEDNSAPKTNTGRPTSRNPATAPPAIDQTAWQDAANEVSRQLVEVWHGQYKEVQHRAAVDADRTTRNSLMIGTTAVLATIISMLVTVSVANRLRKRLKGLRGETLALAEDQLPAIMRRIRGGEPVEVEFDLLKLDFGRDEIGQVASAFNSAQREAVSAAVTEAKTRGAVNAVFLNIARRSQLMMHRQLEILDKAESQEEDPTLLSLLFQLDHLATRERRNAENLIILGGERPGRQWRNPVPLLEVVRGAIAETQDYSRVNITRLPDVRVVGNVVADIIHLLAELVDNAAFFSPAGSRVEASGNPVGKGVVVEIVDQGLGMPDSELVRANEILSRPPDFGVIRLSSDSRLGMIVVALLAARTGVQVRLTESDYGGIRAIVLIPSALIVTPWSEPTRHDEDAPESIESLPTVHRRDDRYRLEADGARPESASRRTTGNPLPLSAIPRTAPAAAEPSSDSGTTQPMMDGRPPLPRRRRQEHLAPELVDSTPTAAPEPRRQPVARTAEEARDLIAAISAGTKQGRHARPQPDFETSDDNREGSHDDLRPW